MASVLSNDIVTFNDWKIGKSEGQYLKFRLDSHDHISIIKTGPKECTWKEFTGELKRDEPCWTIYRFAYETKEKAKREKIILLAWIPTESNPRDKMQYAMCTRVLKRSCPGIHCTVPAEDEADIDHQNVLERVSRFERDEI